MKTNNSQLSSDSPLEIKTTRLLLRQWKTKDFKKFAQMNSDPDVMAYYPNIMNESESNAMAEKIQNLIAERGWGFWAVEVLSNSGFIGFVGLHKPHYKLPITPCIEIGWRLSKECWGKGYATEAGQESLKFAFERLNLKEVYSFASVGNLKSRAVMERLNMINTKSNFNHPMILDGNPLKEHVLYKIDKQSWIKNYQ